MKNVKLWAAILFLVIIAILVKLYIPFDRTAVQASVALAPEVLFELHFGNVLYPISNTLLTTWIVMILITLFAYFSTRKMSLVPSSLQNIMEIMIETLVGLCESVAGPERGKKFFPIVATLFILVLFSNLIGLLPGFGPIGVISLKEHQEPPQGIVTLGDAPSIFVAHEAEGEVPAWIPLIRAPSTDVNLTLGLALISVLMTQVYGMQALGFLGYWSKFFNFSQLGKFFGSLLRGKPKWGYLMGLLDVFIGILELFSEFVKIIAFTFRLLGNIFAGETLLLIMAFLFLLLPIVFYGLELLVAVVQAFVFGVLTLAFMTIATTPHAGAEHH